MKYFMSFAGCISKNVAYTIIHVMHKSNNQALIISLPKKFLSNISAYILSS